MKCSHHYAIRINDDGHPSVTIYRPDDGKVDCGFPLPSLEALAAFVTRWTPGLPDDDLKSLVLQIRRGTPSSAPRSERQRNHS